jgi:hypothetical protein
VCLRIQDKAILKWFYVCCNATYPLKTPLLKIFYGYFET